MNYKIKLVQYLKKDLRNFVKNKMKMLKVEILIGQTDIEASESK